MNELNQYTGIVMTEDVMKKVSAYIVKSILGVDYGDLKCSSCYRIDMYLHDHPHTLRFEGSLVHSEKFHSLEDLVFWLTEHPEYLGLRGENQCDGKTVPGHRGDAAKTSNSADAKTNNSQIYDKEKDLRKIRESLDVIWEDEGTPFKSPADIKAYLDERVYGQDEAKMLASVIVWSKRTGHSIHSLFVGPSGCGKTEIWRQLKKIYPPIYIFDSSNVTQDGWGGDKKVHSCLAEALSVMTEFSLRNAIIVFDEFDKMAAPRHDSHGENVSAFIQSEMLKLVEGTMIRINDKTFDTSGMSFVFLGAFTEIYDKHRRLSTRNAFGFGPGEEKPLSDMPEINEEEMIQFGIIPELMGRIGRVVLLDELTEQDYYTMLKCSDARSPMTRIGKEYGTTFRLSDRELRDMAAVAYRKKLGVRHLSTMLMNAVIKSMYTTGDPAPEIDSIGENLEVKSWNAM